MGNTIEVLCNNCDYRKIFNLGRTANKESAFVIMKEFDENLLSTIKQMDDAYNMTDYDYGENIYMCKNCKQLLSKMTLRIKFENSKDFIPKCYCSKCNTVLKLIENFESINGQNCLQCGGGTLRYKKICDW